MLVFDFSPFGLIEEQYGSQTHGSVLKRVFQLFEEHRGKDFRKTDTLALDEPEGLHLMLFMDRRRKSTPVTPQNIRTVRGRLQDMLMPKLTRAALPYLKAIPKINLGQGLAIYNPMIHPSRQVSRAFHSALQSGALQRQTEDLFVLERLQDIILKQRVVTSYQPIVQIEDKKLHGYEALSRGAPGTGLQTADLLFSAAGDNHLMVELDRLCRRKALLASDRLPPDVKIFVNTLPATIRDPEFQGKHLIEFLDQAKITPDRIVIEITEKLVIDNYSLFHDAMSYFTDLGMILAVDDVGAGYSGLETIARLRPGYLKIDISLVRDVHTSVVNREMIQAIMSMGAGIDAKVIAEGIQTDEELTTLAKMGVEYGQGYYLGRPDSGFRDK